MHAMRSVGEGDENIPSLSPRVANDYRYTGGTLNPSINNLSTATKLHNYKKLVCLFQYVEFSGAVDNYIGSSTQKVKCESAFITSLERGEISAGDTEVWDGVSLAIPAVPPSRLVGCNIINISYVVKVGGRV